MEVCNLILRRSEICILYVTISMNFRYVCSFVCNDELLIFEIVMSVLYTSS